MYMGDRFRKTLFHERYFGMSHSSAATLTNDMTIINNGIRASLIIYLQTNAIFL